MSRIGGNPVKSPVDELYTIAGRILGGSGTATIAAGKGFSLTYVSTGTYKITPDVNYPGLMGGAHGIMSATHVQYGVVVSAYSIGGLTGGTQGTITYEVQSGGSATDLGSSDELWFVLEFSRSVKP